jgi:hypothetical protein
MGWVVSVTPQPHSSLETTPVHIVQEAGWESNPGQPVCNQTLQWLSYPCSWICILGANILKIFWSLQSGTRTQNLSMWHACKKFGDPWSSLYGNRTKRARSRSNREFIWYRLRLLHLKFIHLNSESLSENDFYCIPILHSFMKGGKKFWHHHCPARPCVFHLKYWISWRISQNLAWMLWYWRPHRNTSFSTTNITWRTNELMKWERHEYHWVN